MTFQTHERNNVQRDVFLLPPLPSKHWKVSEDCVLGLGQVFDAKEPITRDEYHERAGLLAESLQGVCQSRAKNSRHSHDVKALPVVCSAFMPSFVHIKALRICVEVLSSCIPAHTYALVNADGKLPA
jgi:hypothetical protein